MFLLDAYPIEDPFDRPPNQFVSGELRLFFGAVQELYTPSGCPPIPQICLERASGWHHSGRKIPQICQAGSAGTLINSSAAGCESGANRAPNHEGPKRFLDFSGCNCPPFRHSPFVIRHFSSHAPHLRFHHHRLPSLHFTSNLRLRRKQKAVAPRIDRPGTDGSGMAPMVMALPLSS